MKSDLEKIGLDIVFDAIKSGECRFDVVIWMNKNAGRIEFHYTPPPEPAIKAAPPSEESK